MDWSATFAKKLNSIYYFFLLLEYIYYDARLNQIISCSNDQHTAVVIGCVRASASSEIQLTESGFAELKPARAKSADPRLAMRKRRSTMSTGDHFSKQNLFHFFFFEQKP